VFSLELGKTTQFPFPLHARFPYPEYIPSQVTADARVEFLEIYWEKRDNLGTRFLCLAGRRTIYNETKSKTLLIQAATSKPLSNHSYTQGRPLLPVTLFMTKQN